MKDMNSGAEPDNHRRRHQHHQHDDFDGHPRGRGRRRGFGPPFGPDFGPGPRRGPRGGRNRGDVRAAILVLLAEQPRHGYDLMRAIEERSGGTWSPSPGSIYPTLQSLEDEGLVTFDTVDGRKTASVTEAGRGWLTEHAAEAQAIFAQHEGASKAMALRDEMHQLRDAVMLAARTGEDTAEAAAAILAQARKDLYALLSA